MNANILNDFYSYSTPCPAEIPGCESLRSSYQHAVSMASQQQKCTDCNILDIKVQYAKKIWELITSKSI